MFEPSTTMAIAGLIGLGIVALTVLTLWQGWLRLKLTELERHSDRYHRAEPAHPLSVTRIEMADVRERLRKLEAIAAGVDL